MFEFIRGADVDRQLRRERNVRKRGREADWQSQKERKTADESPRTENEKARTGDFAEPDNDERSSPPSRRRVKSCPRRGAPVEDDSQNAAVDPERSQRNAAFSESSVCDAESNVDEAFSEAERLATAGALDGDAANLTVALLQKNAAIKTKNVQPKEVLGSKRRIETKGGGAGA